MKITIPFLFLLTVNFLCTQTPDKIVQKQVDSYNTGNLDAFVNCYTKDVVVRKFPSDTLYIGYEKMRMNFSVLSSTTIMTVVKVVNRIIIGNKVIDEEYITANGNKFSAVAIYEVKNDKIAKVTFLR